MQFEQFCAAHGLILPPGGAVVGRWERVATVDHPRTKNGAYKFLGNIGWVQNHATQVDVSTWRPDATAPAFDVEAIAAKAAEFDRKTRAGWERAAIQASDLLANCELAEHSYLQRKGFPEVRGFVDDDTLLIPMRHWRTNDLMGLQRIRWDAEARRHEKKMLPGMRAKGAVFRFGPAKAARTWLVEGYATGLSVEAATRLLRLRDCVVVCFSAGNLIHVASQISGAKFVFADYDESGAGERAAQATGLPYCMSEQMGEDANDMHKRCGVFRVAALMQSAQIAEAPA